MNASSAALSAQKLEKQQEIEDLRARLAETEEDMTQLEEIEAQLTGHSVIVNVPDINIPPAEVTINVPAAEVVVNVPTQDQPTAMTLSISDDTINRLVNAVAAIQPNVVSFTASDELKGVLRQIITHENIQVPGLLDTVNSLE